MPFSGVLALYFTNRCFPIRLAKQLWSKQLKTSRSKTALVLLMVSDVLLAHSARGEPAEEPKPSHETELIETLVKENLANLAKITSFRLEFEKTSGGESHLPLPNGKTGTMQRTTAHGLLLRRGDWFRSDYRTSIDYPGQDFRQENRELAVLNDKEFFRVLETGHSTSGAIYEHGSLADRSSAELRAVDGAEFTHPFRHGFEGHYPYNITDRLAKWVDLTEWTVTEDKSGDDHLYHVVSVVKNTEHRIVTFNASKGYLITAVHRDNTRGKKQLDITITPAQVNGVWVPQKIEEDDLQNGTFMSLTTVNVEINPTIPDSEFQSQKLEFDRGNTRLARFAPGVSRPTAMVYRDDRWVPQ